MDEEVRRIKEKWDKSGSIYDRSVTEAQVNIWTLLSRLKELEERIELAEATRDDALAHAKMFKGGVEELKAHAIDLGGKLFRVINEKLKLEEGIEKHKKKYEIVEMFDEKIVKRYITREDEELYKLIKKEN